MISHVREGARSSGCAPSGGTPRRKWGASVARCPPDRAYRLCSDSECLIVIGTSQWPDNGGTMPSERWVFTTRVEPVSPPYGGGAGHCPRVHNAYATHRLSP